MTGRRRFYIAWTVLIGATALLWVVGGGILEGWALAKGDEATTFSRYVWEINQSWPLLIPIVCYLIGGIQWGFTVHVLWRWNPQDAHDHRG